VFATPMAMFHVKMDEWIDLSIDGSIDQSINQSINQIQNVYENRKTQFGFGQSVGTLQKMMTIL
jgi:hypothetical protein